MRRRLEALETSLDAGALLVAHPSLRDPNFRRSVVFLTAHSEVGGTVGVVANRRLAAPLGQADTAFESGSLRDVPLFWGGPVASKKLILAAWKWSPEAGNFRFFFGIDAEKARRIRQEDTEFAVCGFMGHAGWSAGQLETELTEGSWLVSRRLDHLFGSDLDFAWRRLLLDERPELGLLEGGPADPSVN